MSEAARGFPKKTRDTKEDLHGEKERGVDVLEGRREGENHLWVSVVGGRP